MLLIHLGSLWILLAVAAECISYISLSAAQTLEKANGREAAIDIYEKIENTRSLTVIFGAIAAPFLMGGVTNLLIDNSVDINWWIVLTLVLSHLALMVLAYIILSCVIARQNIREGVIIES